MIFLPENQADAFIESFGLCCSRLSLFCITPGSLDDCSSSFFPTFNQNTSVSVTMALAVSLGKEVAEVTLERSSNRDFYHIGKKESELLMQASE